MVVAGASKIVMLLSREGLQLCDLEPPGQNTNLSFEELFFSFFPR